MGAEGEDSELTRGSSILKQSEKTWPEDSGHLGPDQPCPIGLRDHGCVLPAVLSKRVAM